MSEIDLSLFSRDYQPPKDWVKTTLSADDLRAAIEKVQDRVISLHGTVEDPHVFHPQEIKRAQSDPGFVARCAACLNPVALGALVAARERHT